VEGYAMKTILSIVALIGIGIFGLTTLVFKTISDIDLVQKVEANTFLNITNELLRENPKAKPISAARYKLDPAQSRFMIDANSTGLLWFLGHNHHIAAKDFTGEVDVLTGTLESASLQMTVKTGSLEETGADFTAQQKQIITSSMQKEVLETEKFPEAVFKSTKVTAKKLNENQFEAKLEGDLTLHGVTRHIIIPAKVMVENDTLRATGKFEFDRDDFNIKTHSIKGGTIRVDDDMKLAFEIVARKQ
jgi:polyisoprenoid-binding protein YceI